MKVGINEIDQLIGDDNLYGPDWMYCVEYELSNELIDKIHSNTKKGEDSDCSSDLIRILKRIRRKQSKNKKQEAC